MKKKLSTFIFKRYSPGEILLITGLIFFFFYTCWIAHEVFKSLTQYLHKSILIVEINYLDDHIFEARNHYL